MKLSAAEQLSLATSLIGTALSVLSFFHSPTVVAKGLPQASSQNPLIYSQLKSISHRLDKLEAHAVQPRSQLSSVLVKRSPPALAPASHQLIRQQSTSSISTPAPEIPTTLKLEQQSETPSSAASSFHNGISSRDVLKSPPSQISHQTIHANVHHSIEQGEKQGQQQPIPTVQRTRRSDLMSEVRMLNRMVAIYNQLGQHTQAENRLQQEFDVAQ